MQTVYFFNIEELRQARKQKRNPNYSFSLTSDSKSIAYYINKNELKNDFLWSEMKNFK